ncbi:helix-turn-helix domain-containing protein [Streptomyces brasiliscabiei]|uniref:helix-turn-helix domain-containing protein n=1 Tax=Streptomyces brasiliscabiei TaxID=2736302 RepID=UPI001C1040C5|nr:helix-turn-helix domain-containing protein [Streptomyces brasiliscabiei]
MTGPEGPTSPVDLHTTLLPRAERLTAWRRRLAHALAPLEVRTPYAADFRASLRLVDLGVLRVATTTSPPLEARRTDPSGPAGNDPRRYALLLNRTGHVRVTDGRRTVALAPGDLTFCDADRPFTVRMTTPEPARGGGRVSVLTAVVPAKAVPVRAEGAEQWLLTRFGRAEAMASMLSRHLHDVVRQAGRWSPADRSRVGTVTVDLMGALLAREAGAADGPGRAARTTAMATAADPERLALQNRIHTHILRHLGDPGLGPREVADAHRISLRHLHQLFHEQGLTVAAWIRHRRLEGCRHDLTDPAQHDTPLHTIAIRWGFADAAHFSRLFRAAYDIAPSEYRKSRTPLPAHAYPNDAHASPTTS